MLDQLPDIALIALFHRLPYADRFRTAQVCHRFNNLLKEVWNKKYSITFPYDIKEINPRYPVSSYLDNFGPEMRCLIRHCPNLESIHFKNFYFLQIIMQSSCMTHFEQYPELNSQILEIFIDGLYVTDVDTIREMGRLFPNLEKLTIMKPYPLVHRRRPDTVDVLKARISNLEPQVWALMDDNQRVTEDIRLLLELFGRLKVLRMKDAVFDIVDDPSQGAME